MSNYIIKKVSVKKALLNYEIGEGYEFHPKGEKYTDIKKVAIYDGKITEEILLKKITRDYEKIVAYIYSLLNGEEGSNNALLAYTEIDRLKHILLYKYQNKLKQKQIDIYLKKLSILESEINKLMVNLFQKEEINRGTSR